MLRYIQHFFLFFLSLTFFFTISCSSSDKNTVWIYTSMYPETIELFDNALKKKFPDINIKWYQNGSENVQAKIALEQVAEDVKADLVLTSDIFWYQKMAKEGFWQSYQSSLNQNIPDEMQGPDHTFSTPRISIMVIGYNKKFITPENAPKTFKELAESKWKGKVSSGNPLESGSNFTLMSNLAYRYGYDFLKKLRENDLMSSGGNSAVMKRIITGERPVGLILIENLLKEKKRNPNLEIVYPEDGVILVPGPMGIVKGSKNLAAVQKIYDFILSEEGQKISSKGYLHPPSPNVTPPEKAKSFTELKNKAFPFTKEFFQFVKKEEKKFKNKFAEIMFE